MVLIAQKTESVELLVYLVIGIWRGSSTNKQYPTLIQYEVGTERVRQLIPIQAMSVNCLSWYLQNRQISSPRISETLSLIKYVRRSINIPTQQK
jgi:hypothetical protein